MYKVSPDLALYTENFYRSAEFLFTVWNKIESKLLYILGIFQSGIITIYFDNENVSISASSDFVVIVNKNYDFFLENILCNFTDFTVCIMITFENSNDFKINYNKCSFYYEEDNFDDEGDIESQIDISTNISFYKETKSAILSLIVKELQFLIHKSLFKVDIESCEVASLDAKYEFYRLLSVISNKSIEDIMKEKDVNCILQKYIIDIKDKTNEK